MSATDLAVRLANAFGDVDAIVALLADDCQWHLPVSARTHMEVHAKGKAAIEANERIAFGGVYEQGSVEVSVQDVDGDVQVFMAGAQRDASGVLRTRAIARAVSSRTSAVTGPGTSCAYSCLISA